MRLGAGKEAGPDHGGRTGILSKDDRKMFKGVKWGRPSDFSLEKITLDPGEEETQGGKTGEISLQAKENHGLSTVVRAVVEVWIWDVSKVSLGTLVWGGDECAV